jgi:hypothetical protein
MRVAVIAAAAAATIVAASATTASAQVINLSGQFQCVKQCFAGPPALAFVTQTDYELNLVNEAGVASRGWIDYPGRIWALNWNEGAIYSPDGMTIQFDNGAVWERVVALPPPLPRHHHHHYRRPLPPVGS